LHVWDGIERVRVPVDGPVRDLRPGLHAAQINSLHLFGEQVCHVYPWPSGSEASMATGASALSENVQLPCSMSDQAPSRDFWSRTVGFSRRRKLDRGTSPGCRQLATASCEGRILAVRPRDYARLSLMLLRIGPTYVPWIIASYQPTKRQAEEHPAGLIQLLG
jgi:hypothetical protein